MTLFETIVYHNNETLFIPYKDGQRLTAAMSHWRDLPAATQPETLAEWAFHIYNADLEQLERERSGPDGELAFLNAYVYRLLGLRSLSVGDVLAVTADTGRTRWLACETLGWRRMTPPPNTSGRPLPAQQVCARLRVGGTGR
ncbi:hypothetical protein ACFQY4_18155 [Catellatospora bangladeshensis]|uniref:Uncharacterized protein n=1 Tax=Catellatospora bangladeshensis TaxID=310355 RepID=A0A8J3JNC4_9ACTN|nr:hypothetical protein [Catellatospora bangladeshensis]GIF82065.1 hypothetical protein Cba03nite_34140 [Catellatospora bangladeshensis]